MSDYVNKIAPEHSRTSCDDDDLYNAAYGLDDFDGRGRCYRCTLLMAQAKARIEDAAAPAAPAADALVDGYKISPHCSGICEWVDATNTHVSGTDVCLKCGALRAQGVV